jgi:ferredoxin-like protein FixX
MISAVLYQMMTLYTRYTQTIFSFSNEGFFMMSRNFHVEFTKILCGDCRLCEIHTRKKTHQSWYYPGIILESVL